MTEVGTFWHGKHMSRLEFACLLSFIAAGFRVILYSYTKMDDVPVEIEQRSAAEIVDERCIHSFIVKGKPDLSHFSDLFRYKLFETTNQIWIDADLLCLKPFATDPGENLLARETQSNLNGAILKVSSADSRLPAMIEEVESLSKSQKLTWGITGPTLLTKYFGKEDFARASAPEEFYPILWSEWWKPFLPAEYGFCADACRDAKCVHLVNNIVERSGFWKDLAPPKGSFLHEALAERNLLHLFKDVLPEQVMTRIVDNYLQSRDCRHLQIKEMARILRSRVIQRVSERLLPAPR